MLRAYNMMKRKRDMMIRTGRHIPEEFEVKFRELQAKLSPSEIINIFKNIDKVGDFRLGGYILDPMTHNQRIVINFTDTNFSHLVCEWYLDRSNHELSEMTWGIPEAAKFEFCLGNPSGTFMFLHVPEGFDKKEMEKQVIHHIQKAFNKLDIDVSPDTFIIYDSDTDSIFVSENIRGVSPRSFRAMCQTTYQHMIFD